MVDYTKSIVTAQRLITANGRAITLLAFNETPENASQPWNGPADARTPPSATLPVSGVFVPMTGLTKLGLDTEVVDLLKRSEQVVIISPGATADVKIYDQILDTDGSYWTIDLAKELKPATSVVLAFLGCSR